TVPSTISVSQSVMSRPRNLTSGPTTTLLRSDPAESAGVVISGSGGGVSALRAALAGAAVAVAPGAGGYLGTTSARDLSSFLPNMLFMIVCELLRVVEQSGPLARHMPVRNL